MQRLSPKLKIYSTRQKPRGRKRRSPMQMIALRLNDLALLFRSRYGQITLPDDDAGREDIETAFHHLACLPHPQRRIEQWARLWAPWLTLVELDQIAAPIILRPKRFKADDLAWRMQLSDRERTALGITTIGAYDMPKAQRTKRRKQRDRDRQRIQRRQKGRVPRAQYEANSISRNQPWIAEGISRATWYRRQRETTPAT